MVKADFITGIVLILVGLYVIFESWHMPRFENLHVHPMSVPGLVPAFIASVIIICGLQLVFRAIVRRGHHLGITREACRRVLHDPGNRRLVVTAVLTIVYAGLMVGRVPYPLATGLFVFFFVLIFERTPGMTRAKWVRCLLAAFILAVVTAVAVSVAFERLFLVTLP